MALDRTVIAKVTAQLAERLSEDLFRDNDPWNTEWAIAIMTARKHYRKRRRRFFSLWLDEMREHRSVFGCEGLMALHGGDGVKMSVIYT